MPGPLLKTCHGISESVIPRAAEQRRVEGRKRGHRIPHLSGNVLQPGKLLPGKNTGNVAQPVGRAVDSGYPRGYRLSRGHRIEVPTTVGHLRDPLEALLVLTSQFDCRLHLSQELTSQFDCRLHLSQESLLIGHQPAHFLKVHGPSHHLQ